MTTPTTPPTSRPDALYSDLVAAWIRYDDLRRDAAPFGQRVDALADVDRARRRMRLARRTG